MDSCDLARPLQWKGRQHLKQEPEDPMNRHPHISEFARIDDLPTLQELIADPRDCVACLMGTASITWR